MAIRFKEIQYCDAWKQTSQGGKECENEVTHQIPIQEWSLPSVFDTTYTMGGAVPADKYINIIFPELDQWMESPSTEIRYKVRISYNNSSTEWLQVSSSDLIGQVFRTINIRSTRLDLDFSRIGNLALGTHTANIIVEAYGVKNNAENYIESRSVAVSLKVNSENGVGDTPEQSVPTDKEIYNLRYNKSTKILSGDTKIKVLSDNNVYLQNSYPHNLGVRSSRILGVRTELDFYVISSDDEEYNDLYDPAQGVIYKPVGIYSERILIYANGISKYITINVEVYDDVNDFWLSTSSFDYLVMKSPGEKKSEQVIIDNPNNLSLRVVVMPSFVETAYIEGNVLHFTTAISSSLQVGNYQGEIILGTENVTRTVGITMRVAQTLQSDFQHQPYYFALDKNKISMEKTNPNAAYVKIQLQMYFNGFGREYQEVQSYDYPYFGGKVEIFPGEEIQDFFIKCRSLDTLQNPNFNYRLAVVQIKITEHSDNDEELSEFHIKNLLFAPGRKPKCFPIFTDHRVRGTIPDSIIRVSVDTFRPTSELNHLNTLYSNPFAPLPAKAEVHTFTYARKDFRNDLENSIITTEQLEWIPLPKYKNPIHIFWENQNLVFDWLTASSRNERSIEYEHLTNTDDEQSEKYGTKKRKTLTLNTGWLLREEIDVVDDIIASRVCFIQIGNKTIKAYPISKKNELWDSQEHLFQTDLEFNILED